MPFTLPAFNPPDFNQSKFRDAPCVKTASVIKDGVAPRYYHSTSMFPEFFKVSGRWVLAEESRMDCTVVIREDSKLEVIEARRLKVGDITILGRTENCEEGIYVHEKPFEDPESSNNDKFVFRQGRSRETAYSQDYDKLYDILRYEKAHGNIVWVLGPAVSFDKDSRSSMQKLIENGFADGILAGNAMATHDLEAAWLRTALGQDIYTQKSRPNGHYHHLDVLNRVRESGSIASFIQDEDIHDGIIYACSRCKVPFVLAGSIRDDGPLPEVCANVYESQDRMRSIIRKATTVICIATQLHTIASGNMTPCFRKTGDQIRPVYLYCVDISEFVVNKLKDRGSLSSIGIVTNVQDFLVNVAKGVL